jgi:hypothetical protein
MLNLDRIAYTFVSAFDFNNTTDLDQTCRSKQGDGGNVTGRWSITLYLQILCVGAISISTFNTSLGRR